MTQCDERGDPNGFYRTIPDGAVNLSAVDAIAVHEFQEGATYRQMDLGSRGEVEQVGSFYHPDTEPELRSALESREIIARIEAARIAHPGRYAVYVAVDESESKVGYVFRSDEHIDLAA